VGIKREGENTELMGEINRKGENTERRWKNWKDGNTQIR
jgi:hypothetical protein